MTSNVLAPNYILPSEKRKTKNKGPYIDNLYSLLKIKIYPYLRWDHCLE